MDLAFYVGTMLKDAEPRYGALDEIQQYLSDLSKTLEELYGDINDKRREDYAKKLAKRKKKMPKIEIGDFVMVTGTLPGHLRPRHKANTRRNWRRRRLLR